MVREQEHCLVENVLFIFSCDKEQCRRGVIEYTVFLVRLGMRLSVAHTKSRAGSQLSAGVFL